MIVREIMTTHVASISPEATTKEAARKMHDLHIGALPIIDQGKLVGMLTDRDICCRVIATGHDAVMTKVKEVMSTDITTCYEDQDIVDVAHVMEANRIRRLAVLDRKQTMIGMLSVDDLALGSHYLASAVLEAITPCRPV